MGRHNSNSGKTSFKSEIANINGTFKHLYIHHCGHANDQNDVPDYWQGGRRRGVVLGGRDTRDWLRSIGCGRARLQVWSSVVETPSKVNALLGFNWQHISAAAV